MKLMLGLLGAGVAWVTAGVFFVQETAFQLSAKRATATVEQVTASTGTCGSQRARHACTTFRARLNFYAESSRGGAQRYSLETSAGSVRGQDRATTSATLRVGERVEVLYEPDDPTAAVLNTADDLHKKSRAAGLVGIVALVASVAPTRRRHGLLS